MTTLTKREARQQIRTQKQYIQYERERLVELVKMRSSRLKAYWTSCQAVKEAKNAIKNYQREIVRIRQEAAVLPDLTVQTADALSEHPRCGKCARRIRRLYWSLEGTQKTEATPSVVCRSCYELLSYAERHQLRATHYHFNRVK